MAACTTNDPGLVPFSLHDEEPIAVADGLLLAGRFERPPEVVEVEEGVFREVGDFPLPGVLLLHEEGGTKADWWLLGEALIRERVAWLAVDLRGHGATGGVINWPWAAEDVGAAWASLVSRPEVAGERSAIIGAGAGAELALHFAAGEPEVRRVVLLSPAAGHLDLDKEMVMAAYGRRLLLIIAAEEDVESVQEGWEWQAFRPETVELALVFGAEKGTALLAEAEVRARIARWVAGTEVSAP